MIRRSLPWLGASMSLLIGAAMFFIGSSSKLDARATLSTATQLHAAQLEVAEAEAALGGGDLSDAVAAAERANATATEVGRTTRRMATLLIETRQTVDQMLATSQRGARSAVFAREQTEVASDILAAIAGYQASAERYAGITNRALERVLAALRETNESFPGR